MRFYLFGLFLPYSMPGALHILPHLVLLTSPGRHVLSFSSKDEEFEAYVVEVVP